MGELADLMMEKRKMEQNKYLEELKNAQRAKEAAEHAKYQQGMLGVSQSAESREQALHKYKVQQAIAQGLVDQRFAKAYNNGGSPAPSTQVPPLGPAPQDTTMLNDFIQSGNPGQPSRVPGSSPRVGTPPSIVSQNPDMDYQQRVAQNQAMPNPNSPMPQQQPGMSPVAQAAAVTPQPGQPAQNGIPNQPQGNPPPKGSPFAERQRRLDAGEVVVTKGPDPGKNPALNEFAGQTRLGVKVRDIKERDVDGIRYTTYPDGSETAHKVGPNYEEKAKIKREEAVNAATAKLDAVESNKIIKDGEEIVKYANHAAEVDRILDEHRLNKPFGLLEAGKKSVGIGSDYAGDLSAHIGPITGGLAKQMSRAGGAVVSKMAGASKPQLFQSWDYNKKVAESLMKEGYRAWRELKNEYERLNPNKEYPIKLPPRFKQVLEEGPNGEIYTKSELNKKVIIKDAHTGANTTMTLREYNKLAENDNG